MIEYYSPSQPFTVQEIPRTLAKPFMAKYHYTGEATCGRNVYYGAFLSDSSLYAVSIYGRAAANMMDAGRAQARFLGKLIGLDKVTRENLWELKRLARAGKKGQSLIPLTSFLSQCHQKMRALKIPSETGPIITPRFVLAFADPLEGHTGGIYQAAGFFRAGESKPETHYRNQDGKLIHRRTPYREMKKYNVKLAEKECRDAWEAACEEERQACDVNQMYGRRWPDITQEIKNRQAIRLLGDKAVRSYVTMAKIMGLTPEKTPAKPRYVLPLYRNDFRRVRKHLAGQHQDAPESPSQETQFEPAAPLQISLKG